MVMQNVGWPTYKNLSRSNIQFLTVIILSQNAKTCNLVDTIQWPNFIPSWDETATPHFVATCAEDDFQKAAVFLMVESSTIINSVSLASAQIVSKWFSFFSFRYFELCANLSRNCIWPLAFYCLWVNWLQNFQMICREVYDHTSQK